jgi:hypothetical protein
LRKENYNSIHYYNEEETKNKVQHSENNTNKIYKQCTGQYFPIDIYEVAQNKKKLNEISLEEILQIFIMQQSIIITI